jgi:sec-independent protein translocase protein TatB
MFDVNIWELSVIGIVALLVFGPDKLPEVARTVGKWVGKARAYVNSVKSDIDREVRLQELQDLMKQNEKYHLHDILEDKKPATPPAETPPKTDLKK